MPDKKIVLYQQKIWYGERILGEFSNKDYSTIIDLFARFGTFSRNSFNEIIATPSYGKKNKLLQELKIFFDTTNKEA